MGTKKGASAGVKVEAIAAVEIPAIGSQFGGSAGVGEHQRKFTDYRLQHYASRKQGGKRHHCLHAGYACRDDSDHARGKSPSRGSGLWQGPLAKAKPRASCCGQSHQDHQHHDLSVCPSDLVTTIAHIPRHLRLPGTQGTSLAIENFVALVRGNQDVTTLALLSKTLNVRAENLWDVFKARLPLGSRRQKKWWPFSDAD